MSYRTITFALVKLLIVVISSSAFCTERICSPAQVDSPQTLVVCVVKTKAPIGEPLAATWQLTNNDSRLLWVVDNPAKGGYLELVLRDASSGNILQTSGSLDYYVPSSITSLPKLERVLRFWYPLPPEGFIGGVKNFYFRTGSNIRPGTYKMTVRFRGWSAEDFSVKEIEEIRGKKLSILMGDFESAPVSINIVP